MKKLKVDSNNRISNLRHTTTSRTLEAKPMQRQNFFQSRGSELPKWFPGHYVTYPESGHNLLYLTNDNFPEILILNAWRKMGPTIDMD